MKKTLGEQLAAFMEARGLNSKTMAELVRAVQAKSGDKKTVTRQNIEGLLGGIERPRYLPELAVAMGTTTETLRLGIYSPAIGAAAAVQEVARAEPPAPPSADPLLDALEMFSKAFTEVDPAKRRLVIFALTDLGNHPEEVSNFPHLVRDLLVTKKVPVAAPENENVPPVVGRTQSKLGQDDQRNSTPAQGARRAQK